MNASEICNALKLLSHEPRWAIINLLEGKEKSVTEIKQEINLPQPTTSYHLSALREVGIVSSRKQGRKIYYTLNTSCNKNHLETKFFILDLIQPPEIYEAENINK